MCSDLVIDFKVLVWSFFCKMPERIGPVLLLFSKPVPKLLNLIQCVFVLGFANALVETIKVGFGYVWTLVSLKVWWCESGLWTAIKDRQRRFFMHSRLDWERTQVETCNLYLARGLIEPKLGNQIIELVAMVLDELDRLLTDRDG